MRARWLPLCLACAVERCGHAAAASVSLGQLSEELSLQASLVDGGGALPLDFQELSEQHLPSGGSSLVPCRALHWGLVGNATLDSANGATSISAVGCTRARCPWHRYYASSDFGGYTVEEALQPEVAASSAGPAQWAPWTVLAPDGAIYAAPLAADAVLRIDSARGEAELLQVPDLGGGPLGYTKFSSLVVAADGRVFAIPFSSPKAVVIDPASLNVSVFGDLGAEESVLYKWSHGSLAADGRIYAAPAAASRVLRIDPAALATATLPPDLPGSALRKWVHTVLVSTGQIFGIPGDAEAVLRIDPSTEEVATFGALGAQGLKWVHGVLGIDGRIYCVPAAAQVVLVVSQAAPQGGGALPAPTIEASLGAGSLPAGDEKWQHGVRAPDGRIYCVPHAALQVLRIDPAAAEVSLLGAVGTGVSKWHHAALGVDGHVYAAPADETQVLRIDTDAGMLSRVGALRIGESKYSSIVLAPSGDLVLVPSFATRVLRLAPALGSGAACAGPPRAMDAACILGEACEVEVAPVAGHAVSSVADGSALWVAQASEPCGIAALVSMPGLVNPQPNSTASSCASCRLFSLGVPRRGEPGSSSSLCWAPADPPYDTGDALILGSLTLLGPFQDIEANCTLGLPCELSLEGFGFPEASQIIVIVDVGPSSCGAADAETAAVEGLLCPQQGHAADGNTSAAFQLGAPRRGVVGAGYLLCWAAGGGGPPLDASAFRVHVGRFSLLGPSLLPDGVLLECWAGFPCELELDGIGLGPENRISLVDGDCPSNATDLSRITPTSLPIGLALVLAPASLNQSGLVASFALGVPAKGMAGNVSICWHASLDAFGIMYGILEVFGLLGDELQVNCTLNETCEVDLSSALFSGLDDGRGFGTSNRILLLPGADGICTEGATPSKLYASAPLHFVPLGPALYPLGVPLAADLQAVLASVGEYSLCWSPSGDLGSFRMRIGRLALLDSPCQLPAPDDAASPPCVSVATGAGVDVLRHAEVCVPQCRSDDFTSSEDALACSYGDFRPPGYRCLKRCIAAPLVNNGLSHAACARAPHGQACSLQCPPGTLKSGDLTCDDGRWTHNQNAAILQDFLVFDVPRCYRSCGAPTICAGSAVLQHGDRCTPNCPAGSRSIDVGVLYCRDGAVEPSAFTCAFGCPAPPDIPNAGDLRHCAGAPHEGRCGLLCKVGHVRSGNDPICQNGTWTVAFCLAPCQPPQVANANSPPCRAGLDPSWQITSGVTCEPVCRDGFSVEIVHSGGFSDGLRCSDGVLSGSFVCRAGCPQLPVVEYADAAGLVACRGAAHNTTCDAPCLYGYRRSGMLKCMDGEWNLADTRCTKECTDPPKVENAAPATECARRTDGERCLVSCVPGFIASGISVCEDGAWSTVVCLAQCDAPTGVAFALAPSCAEGAVVPSGASCSPRCPEGFSVNAASLSCVDGALEPPTFRCLRRCGEVQGVDRAVDLSHCTTVRAGDDCAFACETGYRPTGTLLCNGLGRWQAWRSVEIVGDSEVQLESGRLLGRIETKRDFELSFEILLHSAAGQDFQSVLHLTESGNHCCRRGDRVPGVFLKNPYDDEASSALHIIMDPVGEALCAGSLSEQTSKIRIGVAATVALRVAAGRASLRVDGNEVCNGSHVGVEPAADVYVFAAASYNTAADASIRRVMYSEVGLEGTMPSCAPVVCEGAPPPPSGSAGAEDSLAACIGLPYGAACGGPGADWCPEGTALEGRYVCGGLGAWEAEAGREVRCRPKRCPGDPPALLGGAPASAGGDDACESRSPRDICVPLCEDGYESVGGFSCGDDEAWSALPESPPACLPRACGPSPPSVANGLAADECGGLPSGASCEGTCRSGWSPVGAFRCELGQWVEVPICYTGAGGTATEFAVIAGLALRPSSDLAERFRTPSSWVDFGLLVPHISKAMSAMMGGSSVHVLGIATTEEGRRLQDQAVASPTLDGVSTARAREWRVEMVMAVLASNASNTSEIRNTAAAFAALDPAVVSKDLVAALPMVSVPRLLLVRVSSPRLVSLPSEVAAYIATDDFRVAEPVLTQEMAMSSTAAPSTTRGFAPNATSAPVPLVVVSEGEPIGEQILAWAMLGCIPLAFSIGVCVCLGWVRARKKRKMDANDIADVTFAMESQNGIFDYEGLDGDKLMHWMVDQRRLKEGQDMKHRLGLADGPPEKKDAAGEKGPERQPRSSGRALRDIQEAEANRQSARMLVIDRRRKPTFCEVFCAVVDDSRCLRCLFCSCRRCCGTCRKKRSRRHAPGPRDELGEEEPGAEPPPEGALALPVESPRGDGGEGRQHPNKFARLRAEALAAPAEEEAEEEDVMSEAVGAEAPSAVKAPRPSGSSAPSASPRPRPSGFSSGPSPRMAASSEEAPADEHLDGDAAMVLRHDAASLPHREDGHPSEDSEEVVRDFFDFPTADELLKPWKDKVPYYAPRMDEVKAEVLTSSTREDDGGSIVKYSRGFESTRRYDLMVRNWQFSAPVRRRLREREDEAAQTERARGSGTPTHAAVVAAAGALLGEDRRGSKDHGVRFETALPAPAAPPEPGDEEDGGAAARRPAVINAQVEASASTALADARKAKRLQQAAKASASWDPDDDMFVESDEELAESGDEETAGHGVLVMQLGKDGRNAMSAASGMGEGLLSTVNFYDRSVAEGDGAYDEEGDAEPPSKELIAQAVQRARQTDLYRHKGGVMAQSNSARARERAQEYTEAAARRAALAGFDRERGDYTDAVMLVERTTGIEVGSLLACATGRSGGGTLRSTCGG